MALLNHVTREITAKVVYYGPGLCGKTSNLKFIYDNLEEEGRGHMLTLATEADRTLFFDFLPMDLGTMRGFKVRLQLYTVPGQVFYEETRKRVLKGCDGVVLVTDSQRSMQEANRESLAQLSQHLSENGLLFSEVPMVLQYNKRDLPDLLSVEEMDADLNPANAPFFEAVASEGIGVEDTLKSVIRLVLKNLVDKGLIRQEGDSGILAERRSVSPPERADQVIPVKTFIEDTSPGFTPAALDAKEPEEAPEEATGSLFQGEAPELSVESAVDPFAEPQGMEAGLAATMASSDPEESFQGTDPEWLFSEPGEDMASLLAHATPIADAMLPRKDPPDELRNMPESLFELDSGQGLPAPDEAQAQERSGVERTGIPYALDGVPKLYMAAGQVHQMDLVIAGRIFRLRIQLEQID